MARSSTTTGNPELPQSSISLQDAVAYMIPNPIAFITNEHHLAGSLPQSEWNNDSRRDETQRRFRPQGEQLQGANDTDVQRFSRRIDTLGQQPSESSNAENHQHSPEGQERIRNELAENEITAVVANDLESDSIENLSDSDPCVLEADSAQSVIQTGFSDMTVVKAINDLLKEGKKEFGSQDILTVILDKLEEVNVPTQARQSLSTTSRRTSTSLNQTDAAMSISKENENLKRNIMCTECGEHERNVLFLPCKHHTVCENCSPHIYVCFICFRRIKEKVKIYMS